MTVLSKSKILAYLQCPKRLWLEVHRPGLRVDSGATTAGLLDLPPTIRANLGTKPYEKVPFQFSLHYLPDADQELQHTDFLELTGEDPTRPIADALVDSCGQEGPIFVYNKSFEGARIKHLMRRIPEDVELVKALAAKKERLVDLKPIAQDHFYHPGQHGSWSIKSLLNAMVPELSYKYLEGIHDGAAHNWPTLQQLHS